MVIDLIEAGIFDSNESLDTLLNEAWFYADRAQHRGVVSNAAYFDFCAEVPRPTAHVVYMFS